LGERLDRTQEVGGSSPPSSIPRKAARARFRFGRIDPQTGSCARTWVRVGSHHCLRRRPHRRDSDRGDGAQRGAGRGDGRRLRCDAGVPREVASCREPSARSDQGKGKGGVAAAKMTLQVHTRPGLSGGRMAPAPQPFRAIASATLRRWRIRGSQRRNGRPLARGSGSGSLEPWPPSSCRVRHPTDASP
jgi:hypothetical protein